MNITQALNKYNARWTDRLANNLSSSSGYYNKAKKPHSMCVRHWVLHRT